MARPIWIALVTMLLVACTSPVSEEPRTTPIRSTATSEPTQTNDPEPTDTPAAAQADADETPDPTVEPAEQIEPHELTSEELQALSEGTRFDWTSGAIDSDEFGNIYTIVTDIPNYHIRGIDADLMKEELSLLGINLLDSVSYRFEFRNIENFDELPEDASNITNITQTQADPDLATGDIIRGGEVTIVTFYNSSEWIALKVNDFSKNNFGYEAFQSFSATLYMQLPQNLHRNASAIEIVNETVEKMPMVEENRHYFPISIKAIWDDQSS